MLRPTQYNFGAPRATLLDPNAFDFGDVLANAPAPYNPMAVDNQPITVTGSRMPARASAGTAVNPSVLGSLPTGNLSEGLGFNMGTAGLALSGLSTIGSLWSAWQQNKLAKKQFKHTREVTDTNLNNQIQSYNTALTDRVASRAVVNGLSPEQAQAYLSTHSLTRDRDKNRNASGVAAALGGRG